MDSLNYCREKGAPEGSNRYYAIRFAAPGQERALIGTHALYLELTAIPLVVNEPGVAAAKLDWWREELRLAVASTPRHPVTNLLQPVFEANRANLQDALALVDGVAMDLEYGTYPSFQGLADYCHATGGRLAAMLVRICGGESDKTESYSHDLGMGLRLHELLLATRDHGRRGRCYVPEDELTAAGLDSQALQGAISTPALRGLFKQQGARALDFLDRADQAITGEQRALQRSNVALTALYRATLEELERSNYPLLEERQELTPLRRLWIAWRAARRAARRQ
jgi:15-cis-phytoene synthase